MKNIIIVGVSRAGKTTLAQAVARAIGATGMAVSFISADALFGGVTEIKKHSLFYVAFARPLKHLIPALRRRHKRNLRRDLHTCAHRFINEQAQVSVVVYEDAYMTLAQAKHMFGDDKFQIVAIGYPESDIDKKIADIRKYDGDTPANRKSYSELYLMISSLVKASKKLRNDAQKYGIPFIDTSVRYRETIQEFADGVVDLLSK